MIPGSRGSLRLLELFGIPIRIHITFFLVVVWFGVYAAARGRPVSLAVAVLLLVFFCVVLHELGHALMARFFGVSTREIVLYPIGGIARLDSIPSGLPELLIAAAGPVVNLLIAALLALTMALTSIPLSLTNGVASLLPQLLVANVMLFVFNLLPAFPMDGGRILRAGLTFFVSDEQATRFATVVGQGLAVVLGLFAIFGPGRNIFLLLIALFVFFGASQEAAANRTRTLVRGRTASEAMMTRFETLAPQDSLEWAARLFLATHQRDFPVVDAWGRVAGVLDRGSLFRGLAAFGRSGAVLEAMNRQAPSVEPEAALEDVLRKLQTMPGNTVLVQDDEGLRGLVTLEKLMQLIDILPRL